MPTHHPAPSLLAEYATGVCGEPAGVVVASHVSLCSACAATCAALDRLGGAMLEDLPASVVSPGALDRMLAALDDPAQPAAAGRAAADVPADAVFPGPLRAYLGFGAHETPWRRVARGLSTFRAGASADGQQLRLMRIQAGASMPAHRHDGRELTLVLSGGFSDEHGHFLRGDLAELGADGSHAPQADADSDCVCLALNDGGIRLSGLLGRIVTPFVRF